LSEGRAQHAGVEQRLKSQPVQQQLRFVAAVPAPVSAETVKTPCQARTTPSNRTTAVFTVRNTIFRNWSDRVTNPYADCHTTTHEGNTSYAAGAGGNRPSAQAHLTERRVYANQFFSVPQVSMDLPILFNQRA